MSVVEERPTAAPIPVRIGGVRGGPPLGQVLRRDRWWVQPAMTAAGLLIFVGYTIWAAVRNGDFYAGNVGRDYLSPFYSPCLSHSCTTAGYVWGGWSWWRLSPAFLILIFPGAFRATCYYYRKAYYRSFWFSPPACAVADAGSQGPEGGLRKRYTGETRMPLLLQNVHRYAWYFAVIFAGILTWDAIAAFRFSNGFGIGVGTLILTANAIAIWAYTLGCHACRHLCGGGLKHFSTHKSRYALWRNVVSKLNEHHQLYAWCSLATIIVSDLYIYLVASGAFHDPRLI